MSSSPKKALVLSGGSVKGAFQAGALRAIFERGYEPDYIYGISVGTLNGAFLANEAGRQYLSTGEVNWSKIGEDLWNFWDKEIVSPDKLVKKKSNLFLLLSLAWNMAFQNFRSILDTKPLHSLVYRTLRTDVLKYSPALLEIGAVNLYTGDIHYVGVNDPDFIDFVIASTAIPIVMPVRVIKNYPYLDGGVRDIAPFGRAINSGADEIIGICCQAEELQGNVFNYKNLIKFVERLLDIITNETINNDVKLIEVFNRIISENPPQNNSELKKYRHIKQIVIRPEQELSLSIEKFSHQDIVRLMELGYQTAKVQLTGKFY